MVAALKAADSLVLRTIVKNLYSKSPELRAAIHYVFLENDQIPTLDWLGKIAPIKAGTKRKRAGSASTDLPRGEISASVVASPSDGAVLTAIDEVHAETSSEILTKVYLSSPACRLPIQKWFFLDQEVVDPRATYHLAISNPSSA